MGTNGSSTGKTGDGVFGPTHINQENQNPMRNAVHPIGNLTAGNGSFHNDSSTNNNLGSTNLSNPQVSALKRSGTTTPPTSLTPHPPPGPRPFPEQGFGSVVRGKHSQANSAIADAAGAVIPLGRSATQSASYHNNPAVLIGDRPVQTSCVGTVALPALLDTGRPGSITPQCRSGSISDTGDAMAARGSPGDMSAPGASTVSVSFLPATQSRPGSRFALTAGASTPSMLHVPPFGQSVGYTPGTSGVAVDSTGVRGSRGYMQSIGSARGNSNSNSSCRDEPSPETPRVVPSSTEYEAFPRARTSLGRDGPPHGDSSSLGFCPPEAAVRTAMASHGAGSLNFASMVASPSPSPSVEPVPLTAPQPNAAMGGFVPAPPQGEPPSVSALVGALDKLSDEARLTLLLEKAVETTRTWKETVPFPYRCRSDVLELFSALAQNESDADAQPNKLQKRLKQFVFPPKNMSALRTVGIISDAVVLEMTGKNGLRAWKRNIAENTRFDNGMGRDSSAPADASPPPHASAPLGSQATPQPYSDEVYSHRRKDVVEWCVISDDSGPESEESEEDESTSSGGGDHNHHRDMRPSPNNYPR